MLIALPFLTPSPSPPSSPWPLLPFPLFPVLLNPSFPQIILLFPFLPQWIIFISQLRLFSSNTNYRSHTRCKIFFLFPPLTLSSLVLPFYEFFLPLLPFFPSSHLALVINLLLCLPFHYHLLSLFLSFFISFVILLCLLIILPHTLPTHSFLLTQFLLFLFLFLFLLLLLITHR